MNPISLSTPNVHLIQRFVSNWSLHSILAAAMNVTKQSKTSIQRAISPVPNNVFDCKIKLVEWIYNTHGPEVVDKIERLLKHEADIGVALGEAGYTLEQIQHDVQNISDVNNLPKVVQNVFAYCNVTDDRSKELMIEQWRHNIRFLARSIILMKLQQHFSEKHQSQ